MSGKEQINLRNRQKKTKKILVSKDLNETERYLQSNTTNLSYANILKLLISMKMFAAFYSNISDCDETYNYWEPLHFLFYESGFQTWEYSPEYALRSYMYLMIHVLHAVPVLLVQLVMPIRPVFVFYAIRSMLAIMCAIIEFYYFKAILKEFGSNIGYLSVIFLSFAPGSSVAGTALLPSSWSMMFSTAAFTVWIYRKFELAIFFTAISAIVGWPFSALLGLPLALDIIILRKKIRMFAVWSLISVVVILIPSIVVDSMFYGRFTFSAWNIIQYNVWSDKGPELYGTEPLSYYLLNGFLNFNVVWVLSFLAPILIMVLYVLFPKYAFKTRSVRIELLMMPFVLWVLVFFRQPHKEERFLFPIYPLICLCGAISLDSLQKIYFLLSSKWSKSSSKEDYSQQTKNFAYCVLILFVILGFSRIYSQYEYYRAPVDLMGKLNEFKDKHRNEHEVNVCFGKDWYRNPSSFFLPDANWRLRIIRSEFAGMLPVPFSAHENATKLVHDYFNDNNVATSTQLYFARDKCHYLLYFDDGTATELEPRFHLDARWRILAVKQFIDLNKSPRLYRSFAIPLLSTQFNSFGHFYLLKNTLFD